MSPQDLSVSTVSFRAGVTGTCFYMDDDGDPTSSPHACAAGAVPTEHLPCLLKISSPTFINDLDEIEEDMS